MTKVTTDNEHWYEMNEPVDQQSKDNLLKSVETGANVGEYTTKEKHGQLFVIGWSNEELRLPNQQAKERFLRYVRESKVSDDTELDFERAMEDPKA